MGTLNPNAQDCRQCAGGITESVVERMAAVVVLLIAPLFAGCSTPESFLYGVLEGIPRISQAAYDAVSASRRAKHSAEAATTARPTGSTATTGTDAAPSTTVAKAAPAAVPSPSTALTGWRQKAVTDFQPLIGKWEGFVLTREGKKFDYEQTYRDDGTYTFRSNRGMPHSGRRDLRIAGGVYEGKSYKTGESITIAVYEDAQGNDVMKLHRTDGLTWTVAKTESALSSFLAAGGDKVRVAPMAPPSGTTPKSVPGVTSPTTAAKAAAKVFRQRTGVGPKWAVKRCYELLGLETEDRFIESCAKQLKASQ